jgi:hypothetical protein
MWSDCYTVTQTVVADGHGMYKLVQAVRDLLTKIPKEAAKIGANTVDVSPFNKLLENLELTMHKSYCAQMSLELRKYLELICQ